MIKAVVTDLSKVLLFAKDKTYSGKLNALHDKIKTEKGDYDFWEVFEMNEELLELYKKLSQKINIYIFTAGHIQEYPPLKEKLSNIFNKIFSADQFGLRKDETKTYIKIAKMIKEEPKNILYIDDRHPNITASKKAGLITHEYNSNLNLFEYLKI